MSNLLGQGRFGYVHKGVLPCGKEVAVKSLKQGEREFQAEVDIITHYSLAHFLSNLRLCVYQSYFLYTRRWQINFGLAKLSQDNYTHVSTRVMGTFGYLAPEYASSGKLSDKSDVFSFGVMLLELITGRPHVDLTGEMEDSLVDWVSRSPPLHSVSSAAIRHSARRRPKMSQVQTLIPLLDSFIVRALEGDMSMEDLSEGTRPGQSTYLSPGSVSSEYDASSYSADMKKFKKLALENKEKIQEIGVRDEYGLNPSASSREEMNRGSMKRNPQL
ncbi:predicted protein [Arabidopsis lyrata subsp. lyrata]|uniref:non-specific serine/threonine protein kinase n=1 Tax=Arabidopsis lyrata subsp. lyrata TaxID=81972 RepID=D7MX96_ARALL|nr:predicted protein [Arabidopsis lyrata subsp. lyrata]